MISPTLVVATLRHLLGVDPPHEVETGFAECQRRPGKFAMRRYNDRDFVRRDSGRRVRGSCVHVIGLRLCCHRLVWY